MYHALRKRGVTALKLDINPYNFSRVKFKEIYQLLIAYPNATLILHINAPQIPFVLLQFPRSLLKYRRIIGYWAWELQVVPKEWEVGFRCVHEIWVPSHFVANSLQSLAYKYQKKVIVVPHPIAERSIDIPSYISRESLGIPKNSLVILTSFNLSSSFARKNPIGVIAAFKKACEIISKEKISLILKIAYIDNYQDDLKKIIDMIDGQQNIIINTNLLSSKENKALFFHSDIILSLHRSEGFGFVLAEAMQCGKPVISTDWSATSEYIDQECGVPINYKLIPVEDSRKVYAIKNAIWADADIDMAALKIEQLFSNEYYRNKLGSLAQTKICKSFNSDILMKRLFNYSSVKDNE